MKDRLYSMIKGDKARERALSDILESVVSAFEEKESVDRKVDSCFNFIPILKEVFSRRVKVKVGDRDYPLEIHTSREDELLETFNRRVKGKWVIAVDESQHSGEFLMNKSYFYRGSLAFGLKVVDDRDSDREKVLAVLSSFKISDDDDVTKVQVDLKTYIQNLLVGLYAVIILLLKKEKVYALFIDGPLIRQLHPFLFITFPRKELEKLFAVDPHIRECVGENDLWLKREIKIDFLGEKRLTVEEFAKGKLLDLILESEIYHDVLEEIGSDFFDSLPEFREAVLKRGEVPGLFVYLVLLRLLNDLSAKFGFHVCGVVKSSSFAKEFVRFYYSRAFTKLAEGSSNFRWRVYESGVLDPDKTFRERLKRGEIHRLFINDLGLFDDYLLTFCLDFRLNEAVFTPPFEIRRYRSRPANMREVYRVEEEFLVSRKPPGSANDGVQNIWLEEVLLSRVLPPKEMKLYMAYVRTSELKFALRVEFPEASFRDSEELLQMVYLMSSLYRNYGIPIVLRYADNLVRVSTETVNQLAKGLLKEKVIRELLGSSGNSREAVEVIKHLLVGMKRDFYSR